MIWPLEFPRVYWQSATRSPERMVHIRFPGVIFWLHYWFCPPPCAATTTKALPSSMATRWMAGKPESTATPSELRTGKLWQPDPALIFSTPAAGGTRISRTSILKAEVLTRPGACSGIHFHTQFQSHGPLKTGFKVQINNAYAGRGDGRDHRKTGSLYGIRNIYKAMVKDDEWFQVRVQVRDKQAAGLAERHADRRLHRACPAPGFRRAIAPPRRLRAGMLWPGTQGMFPQSGGQTLAR